MVALLRRHFVPNPVLMHSIKFGTAPQPLSIHTRYDALNRRIRKSLGATFTDCLYNGWQCVEDRDHSDGLIAQYVWGIYLDEFVQMQTYATTGSQGLAAGTYYPLSDLLYRTTALTDSSGNIVEAYDTDAYGHTLVFTGVGSTHSWWDPNAVQAAIPACPFIFTGQRFDSETALYYYKHRFYSPALGRFLSRDPIESDVNLYRYCVGSPLADVDPMGLADCAPKLQGRAVGDLTDVFFTRGGISFAVRGSVSDNHLTYIADSTVKGRFNGATLLDAQSILNVDITCKCEDRKNAAGEASKKCIAGIANFNLTEISTIKPGPSVPTTAWPPIPQPPQSPHDLAAKATLAAALSRGEFPLMAAATTLVATADNMFGDQSNQGESVEVVVNSQYWGGRYPNLKSTGTPLKTRAETFTWKCILASPK